MAMIPDQQDIFFILVVSGGPGAGEFVYDASGNLRSSNVGQATTDPVQGISCPQGFATYNGHGAVLNLLSTTASSAGFFQYFDNGSAVQGSLILAIASTSGNDPVDGSHYAAGVTGIDPAFGDSIQVVGVNINLSQAPFTLAGNITANTLGGATSPFIHAAGPEQGHAGHAVLRVYGVSADGTKVQGAIISGTDPPVRATQAMLEVQGVTAPPDPIVEVIAKAAGDLSYGARVSGDTANRIQVDSNGVIRWGSGSAGVDLDLYRASAGLLQTDNALSALAQILCGTYLDQTGIATPAAPAAGHVRTFANTSGQLATVNPQGLTGTVQVAQSDLTAFTVTAATFTQFSKAWSIPAGDMVAGATYRLRVWGAGVQGSTQQALTIALQIGGTNVGGSAIGATFANAGTAFSFYAELELTCVTTGVAGTAQGSKAAFAGAQQALNDTGATPVTVNTTVANTFEAVAAWGATTGAPTVTCRRSIFERVV